MKTQPAPRCFTFRAPDAQWVSQHGATPILTPSQGLRYSFDILPDEQVEAMRLAWSARLGVELQTVLIP